MIGNIPLIATGPFAFITSYYRELSADIKMKNYKNKISERPKALANKTGINFNIRGKLSVERCYT